MSIPGQRRKKEPARQSTPADRQLLLLLWGPASMAWSSPAPTPQASQPALAITLQQRSADGIWRAIRERLEAGTEGALNNHSGQLLALEGLSGERRRDLLRALLHQVDSLRQRFLTDPAPLQPLQERWERWQPELRQQALRPQSQHQIHPCYTLPVNCPGLRLSSIIRSLIRNIATCAIYHGGDASSQSDLSGATYSQYHR